MAIAESELRRIWSGPTGDEQGFVVRVHFSSDDPADVLARARDVLACVVKRGDAWPADDSWPDLLPAWFVERCAPEVVADPSFDLDTWHAQWRAKSWEEKVAESVGPWRLSNWLYYFDPTEGEGAGSDRSWWWWDAGVDQTGGGWIDVATTGWPFGTGSLYWLIEASGGIDPGCRAGVI